MIILNTYHENKIILYLNRIILIKTCNKNNNTKDKNEIMIKSNLYEVIANRHPELGDINYH